MKRSRFAMFVAMLLPLLLSSCKMPLGVEAKEGDRFGGDTAQKIHFEYNQYSANDNDDVWYTDDYFKNPSTEYNPHLSTLSMHMAKYSQNPGNPSSLDDKDWYENQCTRVSTFWTTIGFEDPMGNDDYHSRTAFDTIGVACAHRRIDDFEVIAVTVRSGGYFLEWENNVFLGDGSNSDYMHEGWYNAANKALTFLNDYIVHLGLKNKKVKLWMSGFSRGAATINLTAGILDNRFDSEGKQMIGRGENLVTLYHDDLFAYTFETPQGANINSKNVKHPKDAIYNNIFNIINPNDLVTKVAMGLKMGFTRFGIDKFTSTRFFDPNGYDDYLKTVKAFYKKTNPNDGWVADNLTIYNIPVAKILLDFTSFTGFAIDIITQLIQTGTVKMPDFFEEDKLKVHYDANILMTIIIEEATFHIGSRDNYVANYQRSARTIMKALTTDASGKEKALELTELIAQVVLAGIAYSIFGSLAETILSALGMETIAWQELWPAVETLATIFGTYPNECMGLLGSIGDMFDNHGTNVNLARVKAMDSLYVDDYNAEHSDDPVTLGSPRKTASFTRVTFRDFNDLGLYNKDNDWHCAISIDGHYFGSSDINTCDDGYAAAYYSYADYEALQIWMPVTINHHLNFTDYSKKPYHLTNAYSYYYRNNNEIVDNGIYYREPRTLYDDYEWWSSEQHRNELPAREQA